MSDEVKVTPAPSIGDILADLKGFGIEDFQEVLTIQSGGKELRLKLSNLPTDEDIQAILAVEGSKGYAFFQEVKIEILSRSISWINDVDIRALTPRERVVKDPKDGNLRDIQVILRDTIRSWGQEILQVLWKVLMVHSQTIESRLFESFPDAAVLTEVELRYRDRIQKEIDESVKDAIQERIGDLTSESEAELTS